MPAAARLGFGAALLFTISGLVILDATVITAALLVAPALSWPLVIAVAASLFRMTFTLTALPRITTA
jgi:hypothetical protein